MLLGSVQVQLALRAASNSRCPHYLLASFVVLCLGSHFHRDDVSDYGVKCRRRQHSRSDSQACLLMLLDYASLLTVLVRKDR